MPNGSYVKILNDNLAQIELALLSPMVEAEVMPKLECWAVLAEQDCIFQKDLKHSVVLKSSGRYPCSHMTDSHSRFWLPSLTKAFERSIPGRPARQSEPTL